MTWKENLIKLYFYISEDRSIQRYLSTMRMSNNFKPKFTDEEVMTVYIFGVTQGYSKVKHIYNIQSDIWQSGFHCFPVIKHLMPD